MAKRVGAVIASLVVSGAFLWLALRDVDLVAVRDSMAQANPGWVFVGFAVTLVGIFTRAVRWRGLVDNRLSMRRAFYIVGIMQLMNVLPFRLGEVARAVLATREDIPIGITASSIVMERLLDLITVLVMLAVVVPQVADLPATVAQSVTLFSIAAAVALVVLLGLARYPGFARNLVDWAGNNLPLVGRLPLDKLLDDVLVGLRPLVDLGRFAHAVTWTLASWVMSWGAFYFGGVSLGVEPTALLFPTLSLSLAAFAVAVPVTMAAVGPFQAGVIIAGNAFGVDEIISTAVGFLVHGYSILAYIITGTIGFLGLGVSFAEVSQQDETTVADAA